MKTLSCLAIGALLIAATAVHANSFYVLEEDDGSLHVARAPLTPEYRALSGKASATRPSASRPLAAARTRVEWRKKLNKAVYVAAKATGLDEALIDALILVESGYDPAAVSHKGATGLMQLMPETAKLMGVKDATDPYQNILGGTRYLAQLIAEFQDVRLALAAYNAGAGAVRRADGIPNYPETIAYVRDIMELYEARAWR